MYVFYGILAREEFLAFFKLQENMLSMVSTTSGFRWCIYVAVLCLFILLVLFAGGCFLLFSLNLIYCCICIFI